MMNRQLLIMSVVIPSLLVIPFSLSDAHALKFTNQEIKIGVEFYKQGQPAELNLAALLTDLDDGLVKNNIVDEFSTIAIGQWGPQYVVDDWSLSINHDTGLHKLTVDPVVTEINLPQGQNFATFEDILIDEGRTLLTTKLSNYGITSFTWYLYYNGGLIIEEEQLP